MRANLVLLLGAAALLGACQMVTADRFLFAEAPRSTARPAVGLWAVLESGCPTPQTAQLARWPACATPLLVEPTLVRAPPRTRGERPPSQPWSAYDGPPLIVQLGDAPGEWTFLRVDLETPSTDGAVRSARLLPLFCPEHPAAATGLAAGPEGEPCRAVTREGLLALAMAAPPGAGMQARWIAPSAR